LIVLFSVLYCTAGILRSAFPVFSFSGSPFVSVHSFLFSCSFSCLEFHFPPFLNFISGFSFSSRFSVLPAAAPPCLPGYLLELCCFSTISTVHFLQVPLHSGFWIYRRFCCSPPFCVFISFSAYTSLRIMTFGSVSLGSLCHIWISHTAACYRCVFYRMQFSFLPFSQFSAVLDSVSFYTFIPACVLCITPANTILNIPASSL